MTLPLLSNIPALGTLDLQGQRVLVRVDFDVSPTDSEALALHVDSVLPTLRHLQSVGARVVVASHCAGSASSEPPSLEAAGALLAERLNCDLYLPEDVVGDAAVKVVSDLRGGQLALLENLAREPGEAACDDSFARKLLRVCDAYVNEAPSLLDLKMASLIHLPRMVQCRSLGFDLTRTAQGLTELEAFHGRLSCVFAGGALDARALATVQSWLSAVDTLIVLGSAATAFAAAAGRSTDQSANNGWPAETLAHCRSLLSTAQAHDKKLLWMSPSIEPAQAQAWLTERLPPGPVVLTGSQQLGELNDTLVSTLLSHCTWSAALGIEAIQATQASFARRSPEASPLQPLNFSCLRPQIALKVLTGQPLPVLTALSSAV